MNHMNHTVLPPLILAPAGSKASFLAALAAGADAVYCGLKHFSARMEAKNFTIEQLESLTRLARKKGVRVYVTLNSLIKPDELDAAAGLLEQLSRFVKPDGLIVQDLALLYLARETGFSGKIFLSTLANVSFPAALKLVHGMLGVEGVVLPRELSIDEIKAMSSACPEGLDLEMFVHGALCYGVSGRCYWSSFFGGKSGLRGRCVQPCRRVYDHKGQRGRLFSCQDFSVDVLAKVLSGIPQVRQWKIEGRKKGPHYVFYTVKAYQMLRDHIAEPDMKKAALGLLEQALGRNTTHYNILPQRPQNPVNMNEQTGSGLLMGRLQGSRQNFCIIPREELLAGDVLRIGYEDDPMHHIIRLKRSVPKKGRLHLNLPEGKPPVTGTPIFLTDRREKALDDMLKKLEQELEELPARPPAHAMPLQLETPRNFSIKANPQEIRVCRKAGYRKSGRPAALWLAPDEGKQIPAAAQTPVWWWLPPVIWPEEEQRYIDRVAKLLKTGHRQFVLNSPWQAAFFADAEKMTLWAGPFCNTANAAAVHMLKTLGFSGVIVSPELSREDYLQLPRSSCLPLGIVVSGCWPLCISRILPPDLKPGEPFTSPKGETAWYRHDGSNVWVYPNWQLDLTDKKNELARAGYQLFVHLDESFPAQVEEKKRPGLWNWDLGMK